MKKSIFAVVSLCCALFSTAQNRINGHEYVDLGLPSGLKWATYNVGAERPEEYGDYFAWGETTPKKCYSKENSVTMGKEIEDFSGDPRYDAARANWGGTWRMPTEDEQNELWGFCDCIWTSRNGVKGYRFKSPVNGMSIFIPCAGFYDGTKIERSDMPYEADYMWSSTPCGSYTEYACSVFDEITSSDGNTPSARYKGRIVRAVSE